MMRRMFQNRPPFDAVRERRLCFNEFQENTPPPNPQTPEQYPDLERTMLQPQLKSLQSMQQALYYQRMMQQQPQYAMMLAQQARMRAMFYNGHPMALPMQHPLSPYYQQRRFPMPMMNWWQQPMMMPQMYGPQMQYPMGNPYFNTMMMVPPGMGQQMAPPWAPQPFAQPNPGMLPFNQPQMMPGMQWPGNMPPGYNPGGAPNLQNRPNPQNRPQPGNSGGNRPQPPNTNNTNRPAAANYAPPSIQNQPEPALKSANDHLNRPYATGYHRIEFTADDPGQKWIQAQVKSAGEMLQKNSREIQQLGKNCQALSGRIQQYVKGGMPTQQGSMQLVADTNMPAGYRIDVTLPGQPPQTQAWEIIPAYQGLVNRIPGSTHYLVLRRVSEDSDEPQAVRTQMVIEENQLFTGSEANRRINVKLAAERMELARRERQSGVEDQADVGGFDLPTNRPIGYIGLYDVMDPWEVSYLRYFPALMNQQGYNMVANGRYVHPVNRDPIAILRDQISALRKGINVRDFYLSLVPHGSPPRDGSPSVMIFSTPGGGQYQVNAETLHRLLNEFPDCRFTLHINSCFTGGVADRRWVDQFSGDAHGERRIAIFLETNRFTPNIIESTMKYNLVPLSERGSLYNRLFLQYVSQGQGYGQAHLSTRRDLSIVAPGMIPRVIRSGRTAPVQTVSVPNSAPPGSGSGQIGREQLA
jgi:hypothetical protein